MLLVHAGEHGILLHNPSSRGHCQRSGKSERYTGRLYELHELDPSHGVVEAQGSGQRVNRLIIARSMPLSLSGTRVSR